MPPTDFRAIVSCLTNAKVDYIVVGGLAAVLNGAPIATFDTDIVHSKEQANLSRLLSALETLDAFFRTQPDRRLRPNLCHLSGSGHLNLMTRCGPLDVLTEIGNHLSYIDLLSRSTEMQIDSDLSVRVLSLEALIELKEKLDGDKDRAVLPVLRQALAENRRRP